MTDYLHGTKSLSILQMRYRIFLSFFMTSFLHYKRHHKLLTVEVSKEGHKCVHHYLISLGGPRPFPGRRLLGVLRSDGGGAELALQELEQLAGQNRSLVTNLVGNSCRVK